jgi:predicted NUDIX family NTP pyrophosphohydrolase
MRSRTSAGLALYRWRTGRLEVFLAHPGGPLFAHRDDGVWTLPKGEVEPGEDLLPTALREFEEETGLRIDPGGPFLPLGSIQQKGGKVVHAWGVEAALDLPETPIIRSNTFELEWPPRSGRWQKFPEVDRAEFFPLPVARRKLKERQVPLLDRLEALLAGGAPRG